MRIYLQVVKLERSIMSKLIRGYKLFIIKNRNCLVKSDLLLLATNSAIISFLDQSLCWWLTNMQRYFSFFWVVIPLCLLVFAWNTIDKLTIIIRIWKRFFQIPEKNWRSWSEWVIKKSFRFFKHYLIINKCWLQL